MRSFSIRPLKSLPLIKACPFRVALPVRAELSRLEATSVSCYPAHPLEAYNVERYCFRSNYMEAYVSNYRYVVVTVRPGTPEEATRRFSFAGVVCDVCVDRHLLVVRTIYEVYCAIVLSRCERDALLKKLLRCGRLESMDWLFMSTEPGFFFYPVLHYVQMNRSISRVAVSRAWADIPAPHRELYICVTHWDARVRVYGIYDNMLEALRDRQLKQQSCPAGSCYQPLALLLSELTLPEVQPYASTATSMGYIALPRPEPLPLFSSTYPNRIYFAFGDRLLFTILSEEISTHRLSGTLPTNYEGQIIDCTNGGKASPPLFNIEEHLCEVGVRSSFTAIQHCRNSGILLADAHFLWLFSETNLVEPLIRLKHSLTSIAPVRSIQSMPLVPCDANEDTALPLICIKEAKAGVRFSSGPDLLRSLELVLIMTHAQVVSTVLGVDNETAGLVLSLPYLLAQAPAANMRLWRTPIVMEKSNLKTQLRAITPHGALLGSADLQGYDYISGVWITPCSTRANCKQPGAQDNSEILGTLARLANHYPVDLTAAAAEGEAGIRGYARRGADEKPTRFASYGAEITVSFLSGKMLAISWSARGNTQLSDTLKYPADQIIENRDGTPLLSYNFMNAKLQYRIDESSTKDAAELSAEGPQKHKILACIYAQKYSSEMYTWVTEVSDQYLKEHRPTLLAQLRKVMDSRRPCIPFNKLVGMVLGVDVQGASGAETKPRQKRRRLSDTEEWSVGVIRTLFPKNLLQTLTESAGETRALAGFFTPSSNAGKALVERWKAEKQADIGYLFAKSESLNDTSAQLDSEYSKLASEPTLALSDSTLDTAGDDKQNMDFLVGLMKAV